MMLALWSWRIAILVALLWIGYQLSEIDRSIPSGFGYPENEQLENIAKDVDRLADHVAGRER